LVTLLSAVYNGCRMCGGTIELENIRLYWVNYSAQLCTAKQTVRRSLVAQ